MFNAALGKFLESRNFKYALSSNPGPLSSAGKGKKKVTANSNPKFSRSGHQKPLELKTKAPKIKTPPKAQSNNKKRLFGYRPKVPKQKLGWNLFSSSGPEFGLQPRSVISS